MKLFTDRDVPTWLWIMLHPIKTMYLMSDMVEQIGEIAAQRDALQDEIDERDWNEERRLEGRL